MTPPRPSAAMNETRLITALYALLAFFQFCVLQTYRGLPFFKTLQTTGCIVTWVSFALVLWLLLRRPPRSAEAAPPVHRGALLAVLGIGAVAYLCFAVPRLGYVISTWGDEDHHMFISEWLVNYVGSIAHGNFPVEPATLRYPAATRLFDLPWLIIPGINRDVGCRLSLVLPFLAFGLAATTCAWRISASRITAIVAGGCCCLSPLMLSYTTDKYLDLWHPPVFLMAVSHLAAFLSSPRDKAASGWLAALYCGLLTLVRENAFPTTFLFAAILGVVMWRDIGFRTAFRAVLLATMPFVLFYLAKSLSGASAIDTGRLTLANLSRQDYAAFFGWLPYYLPWETVGLLASVVFFRAAPVRGATPGLIVAALSLAVQLFIYAVFEPGWMPWTRNYLMFSGQLAFCAIVGFHAWSSAATRWRRNCRLAAIGAAAIYMLHLDCTALRHSVRFHENEMKFDFRAARRVLETREQSQAAPVYVHITIVAPLAQFRYFAGSGINLVPVLYGTARADRANFMRWPLFAERLPSDAQLALFCYRETHTGPSIIREMPQVPRPRDTEIAQSGWRVVQDLPDPLAEGRIGMLVLERAGPN